MRTAPTLTAAALLLSVSLHAQPPRGATPEGLRQATALDLQGKYTEARQLIQKEIDSATDPRLKASAQRTMAMSYAFESNCRKAAEYEQMVIAYWKTREMEEPTNAFYQEGEMANEAARVCIDSGDLNTAEKFYKLGTELGLKEPGISADRRALWAYRLAHAEARIAARRNKPAEAKKAIAAARTALDQMTGLKKQQEMFFPYLTGYVALYLGDYKKALEDLQQANQNDAFIQCLIAQTYEKLGEKEKATEYYQKAAGARGHNPPAAYAVPLARKKLS